MTQSTPLWNFADLVRASGGTGSGTPSSAITGFSIDTRSIQPGDVFVALKDVRDGHEFVTNAFAKGASLAIVSEDYAAKPGDGALLRVPDPLRALENIGRAARARLGSEARVVAVTGSAGKTGTKEMLRACFAAVTPGRVHASDKSYNNHWGVPLTLARMPANTCYAVFEIGMNHAGEIMPLSLMVRPHVAIVTTVEAVHLAHFKSVEEIAEAKAEIFAGLEPGGAAIIPRDNPHYELLTARAQQRDACLASFGLTPDAMVRAQSVAPDAEGSTVTVILSGKPVQYRLAIPGPHIVQNSLAVAAGLSAAGADLVQALAALATASAPPGRGSRIRLSVAGGEALLIDESYNANPASMRAALATLAEIPRLAYPRRIAVLGDMLELGGKSGELHRGLAGPIGSAGIDLVFAAGPNMAMVFELLAPAQRGAWALKSVGIAEALQQAVRPGDVIMIKGSNGSRMAPLVEMLKKQYGGGSAVP